MKTIKSFIYSATKIIVIILVFSTYYYFLGRILFITQLDLGHSYRTVYQSEYLEKIAKAQKLFKTESKALVTYVVIDDDYFNAYYNSRSNTVTITEKSVRDLDLKLLAALIAHELAHAESMQKNRKETKRHWQTDLRAAEMTDPNWVESLLLVFLNQGVQEMNRIESHKWLKIFPLIYFPVFNDVQYKIKEIEERLARIRVITNTK